MDLNGQYSLPLSMPVHSCPFRSISVYLRLTLSRIKNISSCLPGRALTPARQVDELNRGER